MMEQPYKLKGAAEAGITDSHGNYVETYGACIGWRWAKDGPFGDYR